jgi:hypothetical protein
MGAHSQSVARSDDPYAETRLSSASGLLPPERTLAEAGLADSALVNATRKKERSLAAGRPGSTRPLVPPSDPA